MGGNKFFITIFFLTLANANETGINTDLYVGPKDDVEFINPDESDAKPSGPASEAVDMIGVDDNKVPSELVITTLQNMPFSGTEMRNGTLVGTGYAFYIFELIRSKMNFTYRIVLPPQSILGDNNRGIIGQLVRKEVDMAVAFIPVLPELRNNIQYSTALAEVEWTILMKRPGESASGSGLFAPFDTNVWILIVVSVVAVGPIMFFLIFIRSFLCKEGEPQKYSLETCMWFVYGALLKQGSTLSPVTDSARLLFATWWIFITILTSFYTANLTAFLTLSQFTLPINSANDLAGKNQKWIATRGDAVDRIINQKDNEELAMLRRSVERGYGEFMNLANRDPKFVLEFIQSDRMYLRERPLVTELLFNDYLNKTRAGVPEASRCTFVIMPGNIMTKSQAFAFRADSTFHRSFDVSLLSLVEAGIIKFITSEHLPGTEICPLNLGSKERQLRNTDLTMTYKGIALGFTVAALAFMGETLYRRWLKRKKPVDDPHLPVYRMDGGKSLQRSPPPRYQNINAQDYSKKQFINGRDYYIVREKDGEKRLVPIRTPSAFLFQYAA